MHSVIGIKIIFDLKHVSSLSRNALFPILLSKQSGKVFPVYTRIFKWLLSSLRRPKFRHKIRILYLNLMHREHNFPLQFLCVCGVCVQSLQFSASIVAWAKVLFYPSLPCAAAAVSARHSSNDNMWLLCVIVSYIVFFSFGWFVKFKPGQTARKYLFYFSIFLQSNAAYVSLALKRERKKIKYIDDVCSVSFRSVFSSVHFIFLQATLN